MDADGPHGLRLPPLPGLRAFEALARHLNFSRAAAELSVTHGAVSHQIKALEGFLGVPLFERSSRAVRLTPAGARYLAEVGPALLRLAAATRELRGQDARRLSLDVLPSFASRWLLPRLGGFLARHPGLDIRVATTQALVTPSEGGAELAIRYGRGPWPGVQAEPLAGELLFPVVSPALLPPERAARARRLPARLPLLRDPHESWQDWFAAQGAPVQPPRLGARIDDSALLLQAAEAGQGVALARSLLAHDALRTGLLVRVGTAAIRSRNSYQLVRAPGAEPSPAARSFVLWLRAELAQCGVEGP